MKKNLILLFGALLLSTAALHAQQHIEFKGVSVDGTLQEVTDALQDKGFTLTETKGTTSTLIGTFSNKEVKLIVVSSVKTGIVWKVCVAFPASNSWQTLKKDYTALKDNLAAKYKQGNSYEFFNSPYREGDGYETTAIHVGKCHYSTFYESLSPFGKPLGNIMLTIDKSTDKAAIYLHYEDAINCELNNTEKNQIISDDL